MSTNAVRSFVLASVLALTGCAAGGAALDSAPAEAEGYQPVTNESGNVVYYDTAGEPYYHEAGRVVYVVRSSPRYSFYVSHYRTYRPYYARWYNHYGYRYRYTRYRTYYRR